jgi:hypothetical protein
MKINMEVPQKKKLAIELPYDSVIPPLSIYPKEYKSEYNRNLHTHVYSSTVHNIAAKSWNQPKRPSTNE